MPSKRSRCWDTCNSVDGYGSAPTTRPFNTSAHGGPSGLRSSVVSPSSLAFSSIGDAGGVPSSLVNSDRANVLIVSLSASSSGTHLRMVMMAALRVLVAVRAVRMPLPRR